MGFNSGFKGLIRIVVLYDNAKSDRGVPIRRNTLLPCSGL